MRPLMSAVVGCLVGYTLAPGSCFVGLDQPAPGPPGLARQLVTAATTPREWIVKTNCTADVLNTPSGTWLVTASHCLTENGSIEAAGATFTIVRSVDAADTMPSVDLGLVQVDGDIASAVGGGFTVGTAPEAGSRVSVYGYPWDEDALTGCDGLQVADHLGYPEVSGCSLPDGVSGGAWFSPDGVLRGVTGGLDEGGTLDDVTYTSPFTPEVVDWIRSVTD